MATAQKLTAGTVIFKDNKLWKVLCINYITAIVCYCFDAPAVAYPQVRSTSLLNAGLRVAIMKARSAPLPHAVCTFCVTMILLSLGFV